MMAVDRMRQATIKRTCVVGVFAAGFWTAWAQAPVASPSAAPEAASQAAPAPVPSQTTVGGRLYGTVKSGNVPLPGVTVVALNTLTGKRFSTTTDITGAWSMKIPQNGRYVVRTEFAAFAQSSLEALLNASSHEQTLNFELTLASRATQQEQASSKSEERQTIRQMAGNAPANLSLTTTLTADVETGTGVEGASGAALPSIATNSDFSGESVAVSGQTGQVSANVGMGGPGGDMGGGLFGGPGGGFGAAFGGGPAAADRAAAVRVVLAVARAAADAATSAPLTRISRMDRFPGMAATPFSTRSRFLWLANRSRSRRMVPINFRPR